ncbi:MAG: hypothetical protein LBR80_04110 [Deltaproteobacteria bacterium]|jgi:hypothetical protein|nr:hypothetical protein [Deltaproteobacteria bacterium]
MRRESLTLTLALAFSLCLSATVSAQDSTKKAPTDPAQPAAAEAPRSDTAAAVSEELELPMPLAGDVSLLQIMRDFAGDETAASGTYGGEGSNFLMHGAVVQDVSRTADGRYAVTLDVPESRKGDRPNVAGTFSCLIQPERVFPEYGDAAESYRAGDELAFMVHFERKDRSQTYFSCVDLEAMRAAYRRLAIE